MIDSEKKLISGKSDVWMIGCIGYFMLYRRQPFEGQGKLAIMSSNVVYPTAGPLELLIQAALTIDANKRVSLRELQKQLSLIT